MELRWTLQDAVDGMSTPPGILITFVIPIGLAFGALSGHSKFYRHARIHFAPLVVTLYSWLGALVPLVLIVELVFSDASAQRMDDVSPIFVSLLFLLSLVTTFWAAAYAARRTYMLDPAQARSYASRVLIGGCALFLFFGCNLPST